MPSTRRFPWRPIRLHAALAMIVTALVGGCASALEYEERWFSQPVDHFRFTAASQQQWKQRYLINDQYWTGKGRLSDSCRGSGMAHPPVRTNAHERTHQLARIHSHPTHMVDQSNSVLYRQ